MLAKGATDIHSALIGMLLVHASKGDQICLYLPDVYQPTGGMNGAEFVQMLPAGIFVERHVRYINHHVPIPNLG